MLPSVSVALCTYNGEKYVREQLESISRQSVLPVELVVCDDCSTDYTFSICKEFAASSPFPIRLHRWDCNAGVTANFETAIGLCGGDIIALCDQDDVWHPEKLRALSDAFAETPDLGAVFSDAELVQEGLEPMGLLLWDKSTTFFPAGARELVRSGRALDVLLRHNVVAGMTMAFRAEFRDLILPIPLQWMHDHWIALLIAVFGSVGMVERPLVKYRQHAGNQAGGRKLTFLGKVKGALRAPPSAYRSQYEQYATLRSRVAGSPMKPLDPDALGKIDSKLHHLEVRGHLPRNFFRRLQVIAVELRTSNYQRYSKGIYSSLADLLFKAA